ncbi:MAG: hypothetical protein AAF653_09940 [Chloroflexota bacterium]
MKVAGDHIQITMDDLRGVPRTFVPGDIISVNLGHEFPQHDVTGFTNRTHYAINGQVRATVTLRGHLTGTADTGTHPVINGVFVSGATVTLRVSVGNNATPISGDPEYSGEFVVASYQPMLSTDSAINFEAQLVPATGTAPSWGTMS